jgi:hypothetical protein
VRAGVGQLGGMASLSTLVNNFGNGGYLDTSRGVLFVSFTSVDNQVGITHSPFREFLHPVSYIALDEHNTDIQSKNGLIAS